MDAGVHLRAAAQLRARAATRLDAAAAGLADVDQLLATCTEVLEAVGRVLALQQWHQASSSAGAVQVGQQVEQYIPTTVIPSVPTVPTAIMCLGGGGEGGGCGWLHSATAVGQGLWPCKLAL